MSFGCEYGLRPGGFLRSRCRFSISSIFSQCSASSSKKVICIGPKSDVACSFPVVEFRFCCCFEPIIFPPICVRRFLVVCSLCLAPSIGLLCFHVGYLSGSVVQVVLRVAFVDSYLFSHIGFICGVGLVFLVRICLCCFRGFVSLLSFCFCFQVSGVVCAVCFDWYAFFSVSSQVFIVFFFYVVVRILLVGGSCLSRCRPMCFSPYCPGGVGGRCMWAMCSLHV